MNSKKIVFFVLLQYTDPVDKKKIQEGIANIPVTFQENLGQWDKKILFQGTSPAWGATISFMNDGLSFGFCRDTKQIEMGEKAPAVVPHEYMVWNMEFKNSNPNVQLSSEEKEESHINYLIGKEASKHITGVPAYRILKYNNIFENIDIRYYSKAKSLEYDFILKPDANISKIEMECKGVKGINVNEKGQLEIATTWGTLLEEIPESYQIVNGEKKLVKIKYRKIDNTTFGFGVEDLYDHNLDLVIDPINLAWSTFVGGAGDGYISDITVDPNGNVYGTGWYNPVFPTTPGSYQPSFQGGSGYGDAYVFKLNPAATAYAYSTYLGGTVDYEQGEGIAVNAAGEVYVTGWTQSTDFPTTIIIRQTDFKIFSLQN
jgi:hypothetical protein